MMGDGPGRGRIRKDALPAMIEVFADVVCNEAGEWFEEV